VLFRERNEKAPSRKRLRGEAARYPAVEVAMTSARLSGARNTKISRFARMLKSHWRRRSISRNSKASA
jgi:hypothetical protein